MIIFFPTFLDVRRILCEKTKRGDGVNQKNLNKIIKSIYKGKINNFEKIIDAYGKQVYGYILKMVKDTYKAEDIFQEVWIKTFNHLDQYNQEKPFSAWLIRIARNTIYDEAKKNKAVLIPLFDYDGASNKRIEDELITRESHQNLEKAIETLKEEYQILIVLKYFEDKSYLEMSHELNLEEKEIKWKLYEARKQLGKILDNEEEFICRVKNSNLR